MDHLLDLGFFAFHSAWLLFNCLGWIWRKTRRWQLVTVSLTALSWFGLGIWYGWGYCPCTDWHWQVLEHRHITNLPDSYITYLLQKFTSLTIDQPLIDLLTGLFFVLAFTASIITNFRDRKRTAD